MIKIKENRMHFFLKTLLLKIFYGSRGFSVDMTLKSAKFEAYRNYKTGGLLKRLAVVQFRTC